MKKNTASQIIGVQMITAADGTAFTGSTTCYYTLDGGTQTIGSVGSGVCTHEGNGFHTYTPTAGETNGDHIGYTFIGTGAIPATVQVYTTFPQTVDNATSISAIKTKTDFLPSATAGAAGGVFIAGTNAATTITTALTTTFTGNVTGSIGSLATQAKADVNAEVVDTLNTDTYAEPGQGAPPATTTLAAKVNYLYKNWRNKKEQTATTFSLYDDAGTTVDQKATVSDDATTATKAEMVTGP